ncbi:hypothetical protein AB0C61_22680 [Streptomyces sp. NPDC048680]|uniref:hypothetical protein n=1 Tax=Streptomyces sp. NPDC048680 TaxID=3155492 RepID=UPI00342939EB
MSAPLLRLYPAGFRRAFGDEIAEAYREATEGAGRTARFREACDIAAHALRLRLGLGSTQRGGRLFAAAAPFALAATAAYAAFELVSVIGDRIVSGDPAFLVPLSYVLGGCNLLALIGAVVALGGRFVAGARCAFAGGLATAVVLLAVLLPAGASMPLEFTAFLLTPMVAAVVPLICPPDLRPPGRIRSTAGIVALAIWAPLSVVVLAMADAHGLGSIILWRLGAPMVAALALTGRRAPAGIRTTGQFALACAPFVAMGYCAGVVDRDMLLPVAVLLAGAAVVLRLWRMRDRDSGTAGTH